MASGRKPTTKTTPKRDWKKIFISELAKCGCVLYSARKANINKATAYDHREKDEEFGRAWDEAIEASIDVMEREARRRGVEGVLKPVFHAGEEVGQIREYSDTLLIFLMKGALPKKYRDNIKHEVSGENGGPIMMGVSEVVVEMPAAEHPAIESPSPSPSPFPEPSLNGSSHAALPDRR